MMKISIITVCFNSEKTIADTLASIQSQSYKNIEYIVVDGFSKDKTLDIVKSFNFDAVKIISEPDLGLYDAMNKGLAVATGDVIGFLNSDDIYATPRAVENISRYFDDKHLECCYGDLCYVRENNTNRVVRFWKSSSFARGLFAKGWAPPHPTFFIRHSVYRKYGGFNLRYKIAADFDWMFRLLEIHSIKTAYIPEVLVSMRLGGATNRSIVNIFRQNLEILSSMQSHGRGVFFLTFISNKVFRRSIQFFVRP